MAAVKITIFTMMTETTVIAKTTIIIASSPNNKTTKNSAGVTACRSGSPARSEETPVSSPRTHTCFYITKHTERVVQMTLSRTSKNAEGFRF